MKGINSVANVTSTADAADTPKTNGGTSELTHHNGGSNIAPSTSKRPSTSPAGTGRQHLVIHNSWRHGKPHPAFVALQKAAPNSMIGRYMAGRSINLKSELPIHASMYGEHVARWAFHDFHAMCAEEYGEEIGDAYLEKARKLNMEGEIQKEAKKLFGKWPTTSMPAQPPGDISIDRALELEKEFMSGMDKALSKYRVALYRECLDSHLRVTKRVAMKKLREQIKVGAPTQGILDLCEGACEKYVNDIQAKAQKKLASIESMDDPTAQRAALEHFHDTLQANIFLVAGEALYDAFDVVVQPGAMTQAQILAKEDWHETLNRNLHPPFLRYSASFARTVLGGIDDDKALHSLVRESLIHVETLRSWHSALGTGQLENLSFDRKVLDLPPAGLSPSTSAWNLFRRRSTG
ncbi:hypothetical protein [Noviherbaspirillum galbum]|uniref:Uncharacterized protein n=1 Tax=Noviherbaspirillum galbum TaxID=2709383 RepID=A0A6B3SPG8_9BURK|nr:hypothetical protein [Noviherbaspirillum galbum]NEX61195.1 hypothetical protein [Noviherbaspirillum galbum]